MREPEREMKDVSSKNIFFQVQMDTHTYIFISPILKIN